MGETILSITAAVLGALFGGGGVLVYLNTRQKNNTDSLVSSASEWKKLYDEMHERLDEQEAKNKKLKDQVDSLHIDIQRLTIELEGYRKFDRYTDELEAYVNTLLNAVKPVLSETAFNMLESQRPVRLIDNVK